MRTIPRAALAITLVAVTVPTLAMAQDTQCHSLRFRSNFRLNSAMLYIGQADSTQFADQKRGRTNSALRVLGEAAAAGGVEEFSLWYLYGRAYSLNMDLVGADSAFNKAARAAASDAGCQTEITRLRKNLWIPLQNAAVGHLQAQRYDSAIAVLRQANLIYRDDPSGFMNLGSAYLGLEQNDSAIAAFRMAAHAGTAPDRAEIRARGAQLTAQLLGRAQPPRPAEAEAAWREYITLKPNDMAARGSLAASLVTQRKTQEAAAVYDSLISRSDALDALGLFDIGVSLFRLAQNDSTNKAMWFQRAARAFEAGLTKSPFDRDGLFNAANTYLALADTAKLLDAATRLVAADSMNRRTLSMLAQAQVWSGRRTEVVRTLMRRDSLPFEVSVLRFEARDSSANIRGGVQNLRNRELAGFNLTIEFLNGTGAVVASERTEIPSLNPQGGAGASYDFTLQVAGRGIVAYRYKIGG